MFSLNRTECHNQQHNHHFINVPWAFNEQQENPTYMYASGTRIEVSGWSQVLRRYVTGGRVMVMMKQGRDGTRMKRNLWQTAGRDVLHVTGGQLHTASWDRPRGGGTAHWVMGPGAHWEVGPGTHRDCIWSHGHRGADRHL